MEMPLLLECSSLSDAPIYNAVISSLRVFHEDYPVLLKSVSNPEPIARGNIFRNTSLRLAPPRPNSQKTAKAQITATSILRFERTDDSN